MRAWLTIDIIVSVLLPAPSAPCLAVEATPSANLIKNSSFEVRSGRRKLSPVEPWGYGHLDGVARSPFAHWGYSGFWDGGDYDLKLGQGHTGKLCARLVCRKRGRGGICTEEIRVAVGTKLRFRGFFRAKGARGRCWINFEGDPGDGWAQIDLPEQPDYGWQEVTDVVTVKPPRGKHKPGPDGKVRIHVFIYTRAYGELWIDDVTLTPVQEGEDKSTADADNNQ